MLGNFKLRQWSKMWLNVLAVAIVAIALGGPALATAAKDAGLIGSKDIKSSAVTSKHIKNGSIAKRDLDRSLQRELSDTKRRLAKLEAAAATPGPQGPAGPQGPQGPQGESGPAGKNGADGDTGPKGADGKDGQDGAKGDQGDKGDTGDAGEDGQKGDTGDTGPQGPVGPQGPQGDPGQNSDDSYSRSVSASGDQGVSVQGVAGSGGNNGSASITENGLQLSIAAPGGGFAGAYKSYTDKPLLSSLKALSYQFSVSNRAAGTKVAPAIKIDVQDATPCEGAGCANPLFTGNTTTLVYEPTYTEDATLGGVFNTLISNADWWSTRGAAGVPNRDVRLSLNAIRELNPNARITRIYVEVGQNSSGAPWSVFDGVVNWLNIGFDGSKTDKFVFGTD